MMIDIEQTKGDVSRLLHEEGPGKLDMSKESIHIMYAEDLLVLACRMFADKLACTEKKYPLAIKVYPPDPPDVICLPLWAKIGFLSRQDNVPDEVYSDELLEHPGVPGLMLSRAERLYDYRLEFSFLGAERWETGKECRMRYDWKMPPVRKDYKVIKGADHVKFDRLAFAHSKIVLCHYDLARTMQMMASQFWKWHYEEEYSFVKIADNLKYVTGVYITDVMVMKILAVWILEKTEAAVRLTIEEMRRMVDLMEFELANDNKV